MPTTTVRRLATLSLCLLLAGALLVPTTMGRAKSDLETAAAASFKTCCKDYKADLKTCEDTFGGDPPSNPEALAVCKEEAANKFRNCVADLLVDFGFTIETEAVVQACPAQLPL